MEETLEPRWWQKFGSTGLILVVASLICGFYLFDPPIQQSGSYIGQVRAIVLTEQPKIGFRQFALVRLTSGESVQAKVVYVPNHAVAVGDVVSLRKYEGMRSNRVKFVIDPTDQSSVSN